MDPPEFSTGGRPSPKLQGPRPSPLKVNKDSYKIRKPPVAPQLHQPYQLPTAAAPPQQEASTQNRQTVVIYTVSPKVIHTTVNDFMGLVQRLTGPSPRAGETSTAARGAGDVSPAARLASLERASPSERERNLTATSSADNIIEILEGTDAEMSQIPGILTPEPTTLPPISPPGLFSPAMDPFLQGGNMFITSPSILFSSPIISPNPSFDLFNPFFDFY